MSEMSGQLGSNSSRCLNPAWRRYLETLAWSFLPDRLLHRLGKIKFGMQVNTWETYHSDPFSHSASSLFPPMSSITLCSIWICINSQKIGGYPCTTPNKFWYHSSKQYTDFTSSSGWSFFQTPFSKAYQNINIFQIQAHAWFCCPA